MARYEIRFKRSVTKDLRQIPSQEVKRILARIDRLADDPRAPGCIKLAPGDRYRLRLGVYRIIYQIEDKQLVIQIVKIAHRSSAYRGR